MSSTPYSDEWRSHVQRRLFDHGTTAHAIGKRIGLGAAATDAILGSGPVSLEVAGPIEEALNRLDEGLEGRTPARSRARLPRPPRPRVKPGELYEVEWANVDALAGARVHLARRP